MIPAADVCPGCGRVKRTYRGRKHAAVAAASARRRTGDSITPYHCPAGGGVWHIGHTPRAMRREAAA